ncbi:hypothetical protein SAMN05216317_10295 [Nitrosomonas eutropha]|nr:hypothetical protein SAMN05216317_10295 [Nitrosomonas eutropha]
MALPIDAKCKVHRLVDNPVVLPDFQHNTVQINDRVNCIQGRRHISVVHFPERINDVARAHALGVKRQNLVISICVRRVWPLRTICG